MICVLYRDTPARGNNPLDHTAGATIGIIAVGHRHHAELNAECAGPHEKPAGVPRR